MPPHAAFAGHRLLASGSLSEVALAVKRAVAADSADPVLTYDDAGHVVDLDLRGTDEEVPARLDRPDGRTAEPRGRGRPKLGVIAREVTLLPRHWEWLGTQPGGASVALRKLVDVASRSGAEHDRERLRREAAYRFMSSIAGDFAGFEEASRALFAGDGERLRRLIADWPRDIRDYVLTLAGLRENGGG
jgi:hypothetical protein